MWTDLWLSIVNGETLLLDTSGAAWWPAQRTLIFADLHFEKGSSYARGGQFLPPYDTRATLLRMAEAMARRAPARVIALGDILSRPVRGRTAAAGSARDAAALGATAHFVWITGNHDPHPPAWLGGAVMAEWREGGLDLPP